MVLLENITWLFVVAQHLLMKTVDVMKAYFTNEEASDACGHSTADHDCSLLLGASISLERLLLHGQAARFPTISGGGATLP